MASSGGAPVSEAGLARTLGEKNPVTIFCHRSRLDASFADSNGLRLPIVTYGLWDLIRLVLGLGPLAASFDQIDILHINGYWRWENTLLAWRSYLPFVLHPRGMMAFTHRKILLKRFFHLILGRYLIKKSAAIIALSVFERDRFIQRAACKEKTAVIPNGIEIPFLPLGVPAGKEYFLYFGRIESRKNLTFLIEAFSLYVKKGGSKKLVLMGPVERSYDTEIKEKAAALGVGHLVQIEKPEYGAKKNERIALSQAVVYPAIDEAFGRVPFEAIANGVSPIIPEASGAAEYLRSYFSRLIYQTGDRESLRNALFESEKDTAEQLSAAQKWVSTELNWKRIADRVECLYKTILNDDKATSRRNPRLEMPSMRKSSELGG